MMLSRQGPNENGNAQRRYRVLPLTLDTGEVLPTLVDSVSLDSCACRDALGSPAALAVDALDTC
jgi:hypothetical protein